MRREAAVTPADLDAMMPAIREALQGYPYDKFYSYPARRGEAGRPGWVRHFVSRLEEIADDSQWRMFGNVTSAGPLLLAARTARWDREHLGFPLSTISVLLAPDEPDLRTRTNALLRECLSHLVEAGVKFASARITGDHLDVAHAFEDAGFRYIETVVWPVASTENTAHPADARVRLLEDRDIELAANLAARHSYPRTRFYSDGRFAKQQIGQMYAGWVKTAWHAGDPVLVVESDGIPAGVFTCRMDSQLSADLGVMYGRMGILAVDAEQRGKGLGKALFHGCVCVLHKLGAQYVDSGYSTKNHVSARLHAREGFDSKYEETTFHLWL
ncbi:MAG: hypothetical protein H0U92_06930 [Actinobacteria bacterium]|nr:hypothetical protein [Actinomycetota bacterium]